MSVSPDLYIERSSNTLLAYQEVQNEAADHGTHLVGNLQLDKMTRTDDLAAHQLRAPLGETVRVSEWPRGRNVEGRHLVTAAPEFQANMPAKADAKTC